MLWLYLTIFSFACEAQENIIIDESRYGDGCEQAVINRRTAVEGIQVLRIMNQNF